MNERILKINVRHLISKLKIYKNIKCYKQLFSKFNLKINFYAKKHIMHFIGVLEI